MIYLAIFFYSASLIFQIISAALAFGGFKYAGKYKFGWLFFSAALLLMIGRRISPIYALSHDPTVTPNVTDAILALPISFLLMLSVITIRKTFDELEDKSQKLEKSQRLDYLTGAINRLELVIIGESEIERSFRTTHPFSILMLDIDHFKRINDVYGHQTGDNVLKSLTCICQNTLRKIDSFGRYGGEEFVIILPETNKQQAQEVAERLRHNVSENLNVASGLSNEKITISIGGITFKPSGNRADQPYSLLNQLIEQADVAMYQAKNNGRDQVVLN